MDAAGESTCDGRGSTADTRDPPSDMSRGAHVAPSLGLRQSGSLGTLPSAREDDVDTGAWLLSLGLERYERAFRDNDVDADVLPDLTADDLVGLGVVSI